jgi:hypothetical protein
LGVTQTRHWPKQLDQVSAARNIRKKSQKGSAALAKPTIQ